MTYEEAIEALDAYIRKHMNHDTLQLMSEMHRIMEQVDEADREDIRLDFMAFERYSLRHKVERWGSQQFELWWNSSPDEWRETIVHLLGLHEQFEGAQRAKRNIIIPQ